MQAAQPVNSLTNSVGFNVRYVAITQVDQAQGLVVAVDEQRVEVRMPLLVTRAKGRLPVAGEAWLADQTLGFWSLAAYVAPNIDALRNMLDLGTVQVDKLELPSGVASESIPGQIEPSPGDVGLATEHAGLIFRSPAMADPADNRVRMGLYSQNANGTSSPNVFFFDDTASILSLDKTGMRAYGDIINKQPDGSESGYVPSILKFRESGSLATTDYDSTGTEVIMSAMTFSAQDFTSGYTYSAEYLFEATSSIIGDRIRFRVRLDNAAGFFCGGVIKKIVASAATFESMIVKAIWVAPDSNAHDVVVTVDRFSGTGTVTGRITTDDTYGIISRINT
jgi:hypothetical protein